MAAFWDKIKSVGKDPEEKKEQEKKAEAEKTKKDTPSDVKDVKPPKEEEKQEKKEESVPKPKDGSEEIKEKKDRKEKEPKKAKKKTAKKEMSAVEAKLANKLTLRPKVSEAAMNQQVLGKYVFQVSIDASKTEIAQGIEAIYGVTVEKVHTICYKPKSHGFRGKSGKKTRYKKAIVSLKKGESIELFKEAK